MAANPRPLSAERTVWPCGSRTVDFGVTNTRALMGTPIIAWRAARVLLMDGAAVVAGEVSAAFASRPRGCRRCSPSSQGMRIQEGSQPDKLTLIVDRKSVV